MNRGVEIILKKPVYVNIFLNLVVYLHKTSFLSVFSRFELILIRFFLFIATFFDQQTHPSLGIGGSPASRFKRLSHHFTL